MYPRGDEGIDRLFRKENCKYSPCPIKIKWKEKLLPYQVLVSSDGKITSNAEIHIFFEKNSWNWFHEIFREIDFTKKASVCANCVSTILPLTNGTSHTSSLLRWISCPATKESVQISKKFGNSAILAKGIFFFGIVHVL